MRVMTNLDVNFNEISNAVVNGIVMKPLASAPANPREGQFYYDSIEKQAFQYDGSNWIPMGGTITGSEGDMVIIEFADGVISASIVDGSITKAKLAEGVQTTLTNADTHMQNGDIHVTTDDKTNWADKYTKSEIDGKVEAINEAIDAHTEDGDIHVTTDDKAVWADKYTKLEIDGKVETINNTIKAHTEDADIHVTTDDKANWGNKYTKSEIDGKVDGLQTEIGNVNTALGEHSGNADVHVTVEDKAVWADKYTKTETDTAIATAIANAEHLKREIVEVLPTENIDEHTIYMIKKGSSETGDNYEEYMLIEGALVKIGDTTVDLSDYLTKTGDASNTTVTLDAEVSSEEIEIASGDKLGVAFAKIKNYFGSLHAVATSGDYNDLINKPKTTFVVKDTMTAGETTFSKIVDGEVTNVILTETNEEGNSEIIIGGIEYNFNSETNKTSVVVTFATANDKDVEVKISYIA